MSPKKYAPLRCSWHNAANVMYVDQPAGTGLSFTTKDNYADNDQQVRSASTSMFARRVPCAMAELVLSLPRNSSQCPPLRQELAAHCFVDPLGTAALASRVLVLLRSHALAYREVGSWWPAWREGAAPPSYLEDFFPRRLLAC